MYYSPLVLSLWVSVLATSIIAVFGTLIAYVLARKRFLGRTMLDAFTTLPMILPPTVTGYYLIILLGKAVASNIFSGRITEIISNGATYLLYIDGDFNLESILKKICYTYNKGMRM